MAWGAAAFFGSVSELETRQEALQSALAKLNDGRLVSTVRRQFTFNGTDPVGIGGFKNCPRVTQGRWAKAHARSLAASKKRIRTSILSPFFDNFAGA